MTVVKIILVALLVAFNIFLFWGKERFSTSNKKEINVEASLKSDSLKDNLGDQINSNKTDTLLATRSDTISIADSIDLGVASNKPALPLSAMDSNAINQGMVDIQQIIPDILIDLKYASEDNFMGSDVYGSFRRCYLQPEVAQKLEAAQDLLKAENDTLTLMVFDGLRPLSVQYKMWERVKNTKLAKYVANPKTGSMHNIGVAVDITLASKNGKALDLGTEYDYFGELAQPRHEEKLLKSGRLNEDQIANRALLRKVMLEAGFVGIKSEWWHFNGLPKDEARKKYGDVNL